MLDGIEKGSNTESDRRNIRRIGRSITNKALRIRGN